MLTLLPELLRAMNDYRMLIYAIVLILVMLVTNNPTLKNMVQVVVEKVTGVKVPAQVKALRTLPVRHKQQCEKDKMAEAVMEAFGK